GTVARIVQGERSPDGRYSLVTVGTDVFEVEAWLDDAPYPRADVVLRAEPTDGDPEALRAARDELERLLRRVLALRTELGLTGARATAELTAEPVSAGWHAALL